MQQRLRVNISIEDTPILHFGSFTLKQQFNGHHYFELRFNHDQIGLPGMITLEKSRGFMGKNLCAEFGLPGSKEQTFIGKVTRVELCQSHGYHGILIVSGYSPTILLDRGADLGSYLGKDLAAIVKKATEDTPANDLNIQVQPSRTQPVDYLIQYRETDFAFINRLSAEYHEWFFYDGVNLHFGKPEKQEEVALVYGRDLHSLQYGMNIAPLQYNRFAYKPSEDQLLQSSSRADGGNHPDLSHAVQASAQVFSKVYNQPTAIRVDSKADIDSHVSNATRAQVGDLLKVNAAGDNPQVKLGSIVDISMSVRQDISDFTTESLGKFLVTSVYHEIDGVGHYHNSFEAIVAGTERIHVESYHKPQPDIQLATVIDNADPQGQGRIKVQFKWQCNCNDVTEWLRVVTPDAGSSDRVNKNRGFVFIPERGDQVLVAFEEGNIARPIVMGSVFHGNNGAGGGSDNITKSISTRSGHTIELNDNGQNGTHIIIKDPAGNIIHLDSQGKNITITAPETMTLNAKNVVINAAESVVTQAGTNISSTAGKNISASAGSNIVHNAVRDLSLTAENIMGTAEQSLTHNASNITKRAGEIHATSTDENFQLFSSKQIVNTSGEKGKLF